MVIRIADRAEAFTQQFIIRAVREKLAENHRMNRLQDYYEGRHDILLREFAADPSRPNNKIVVNYCKSIADFLTSYLCGVPIQYEAPSIISDNLNYNDNANTTMEIVSDMNILGMGCELFYFDEDSIPRFAAIDPRECIFVTDDSIEGKLVSFIRFYPRDYSDKGIKGYNVISYSNTGYVQYILTESVGALTPISQVIPHYFQDVPAILYRNNKEMIGTFEGIISLQNALNKLMSDTLNDYEGFVDSYLILEGMQGTKAEDIAEMKTHRVLLLDPASRAYWLTKQVNNAHIEAMRETLTAQIRELGNIPDLENLGALASGVALRFRLIPTEIQASKQERELKKGIQRKLELLYNAMRIIDPNIGSYTDVAVNFERNFVMMADDKQKEAVFDLGLVKDNLISPVTFLMTHKDMTEEEAKKELRSVGVDV